MQLHIWDPLWDPSCCYFFFAIYNTTFAWFWEHLMFRITGRNFVVIPVKGFGEKDRRQERFCNSNFCFSSYCCQWFQHVDAAISHDATLWIQSFMYMYMQTKKLFFYRCWNNLPFKAAPSQSHSTPRHPNPLYTGPYLQWWSIV